MAVESATLGPVNPPPQPNQPITEHLSIAVDYSLDCLTPVSGTVTIFAQRADGSIVELKSEPLRTDLLSNTHNVNDISLGPVGDAHGVRFFARITEGGTSRDTELSAPYSVDADGDGDVDPDPTTDDPEFCLLAGTRIRTPGGETPVEALRIGDLVLTVDGRAEPILFIGRQTFSLRFADPGSVWPVRIRAGALAEGVPSADLHVSPFHALHIDGVLMFAQALQNGGSIAHVKPEGDSFTYYSLELERHEVILAEGAEVESFADNVPRSRFHNYAEYLALYPEPREVGEMDLPHARSARQVPAAIRARIAERAAMLAGEAQDRSAA